MIPEQCTPMNMMTRENGRRTQSNVDISHVHTCKQMDRFLPIDLLGMLTPPISCGTYKKEYQTMCVVVKTSFDICFGKPMDHSKTRDG